MRVTRVGMVSALAIAGMVFSIPEAGAVGSGAICAGGGTAQSQHYQLHGRMGVAGSVMRVPGITKARSAGVVSMDGGRVTAAGESVVDLGWGSTDLAGIAAVAEAPRITSISVVGPGLLRIAWDSPAAVGTRLVKRVEPSRAAGGARVLAIIPAERSVAGAGMRREAQAIDTIEGDVPSAYYVIEAGD